MEKHTLEGRVESNIPRIDETLAKAYKAAEEHNNKLDNNKDKHEPVYCTTGRSGSGKETLKKDDVPGL